ncbi:hypothetical protein [Candidatus Sororendozoicomonas aggregata]|uniref:hypothetical protein n=1 Tax=Candidatus Sororendozoicomonas aggregata TaxID=3073239 RepID=UPI002ED6605C
MCMRSTLNAIKGGTKKSFVFFTLVLNLSIMGNAYSKDSYIYVENKIPPGDIFYSKKGYTVEAAGKGPCMYGVYSPALHTATYEEGAYGRVGIHYSSKGGCAVRDSTQNFKVINNDTGKVAGMFTWEKLAGNTPFIKMINNPTGFMMDVTLDEDEPNVLNIRCLPKFP